MTKPEFVAELANRTGMSKKDAGIAYDAFLEIVKESVTAGDRVNLQGVGKFKFTRRDARTGRNPHTGESVDVPAKTYVAFQIAWKLKQACGDVEVTEEDEDGGDTDE